jgi:hypothetical protein
MIMNIARHEESTTHFGNGKEAMAKRWMGKGIYGFTIRYTLGGTLPIRASA